jgi:hypothetical protein
MTKKGILKLSLIDIFSKIIVFEIKIIWEEKFGMGWE